MISVFRVTVLATVYLSLALSAGAGPRKEIRDWYVWCDDVLKCVMQTTNEEGIYGFGFERSPQANAEPILFLSTSINPAKDSRISVVIDGVSGKRFVLDTGAAQFEEGVWEFPGQNPSNVILNAMMVGKSLVLKFDEEGGSRKLVTLSLSGVTGSALFMDEAQGRLGKRDALQAKGDGDPADAITRVTVLKSSADLPAQVLSYWRSGSESCSEGRDAENDLISDFGGIMVAVEDAAQLFVVPCGLPGAYNLLHTVLLFDTGTKQVRTASLPIMGQRGPTLMDFAYNTDWDDKKSTLSAFFKGRGLGDCGSRSVWYWEGGYYSNFELVEEYVKGNCDGKYDDWPQIWPPQ